jgi:hypothetical protein
LTCYVKKNCFDFVNSTIAIIQIDIKLKRKYCKFPVHSVELIIILSHVCGDYTRRGLDCQLDLLDLDTDTLNHSVNTLQLEL